MSCSKKIIKTLVFLLLAHYSQVIVKAQVPVKLRSTLGIGGSSDVFSSGGRQYMVQQSVGQTSVINSYPANGYILRQGFIQPLGASEINTKIEKQEITVTPNPFTTDIKLSFSDYLPGSCYVTLYNLHGKIIYNKEHANCRQLNLSLSNLKPGLYLIKVNTGKRVLVTRLVKI